VHAAKAFKLSVTQLSASFCKSLNLLLTRSRRRFVDTVLLSLIETFVFQYCYMDLNVWIVIPVTSLVLVSP